MSATLFGAASLAGAQALTDIERAPTLTVERHGKDRSSLADPARRTLRWTEPFTRSSLGADGSVSPRDGRGGAHRF